MIVGAIAAGVGWLAANGGGGEGDRLVWEGEGVDVFSLSGLVLNAINGYGQNAAGGSLALVLAHEHNHDQKYGNHSSRNGSTKITQIMKGENRGMVWVQGIIENIVGAAERGGWLAAARSGYGRVSECRDGASRRG